MSKKNLYFALLGLLLINLVVVQALALRNDAFEQLDLLVDVRHEIVSEYVEEPDEKKMVEAAVRAMVESLGDPYTVYLSPEEMPNFDKQVRGTFSGIGAEIDIHENFLRIVAPLEESPAWNAGIAAGDIVLEIDGKSAKGITINQAIERLTGEEGTNVVLKVRHRSGKEQSITVTRARINIPTVKGVRKTTDNHWQFMLDAEHGIGYIRLTQFTDQSVEKLSAALDALKQQGAHGLILDLRFNPGGLLDAAVKVSDMFLDGGKTIVSVRGRTSRERSYESSSQGAFKDVPMIVLVNESSASASEIVSGALKDNGRAKILGTRTFGKGSVQQVKMLESGHGAIKITNALYYLPSGRNIHRREGKDVWGVDPDEGFYVPMSSDEVLAMLKIRREQPVQAPKSGEAPKPLTPEIIEKDLADKQLAAAVKALVGRVTDGKWPTVGQTGVKSLARLAEIEHLRQLETELKDRLTEVRQKIEKLDKGESEPDNAPTTNNGDSKSEKQPQPKP